MKGEHRGYDAVEDQEMEEVLPDKLVSPACEARVSLNSGRQASHLV